VLRIEAALFALESEGFVLRGRFTRSGELEWCERRLLARIHRYTLGRLRSEIEPVTQVDFMRFVFSWQRLTPDSQGRGPSSLALALARLEGFEAPAASWESELLPARIADYEPSFLDALCLSGKLTWFRRSLPAIRVARSTGPVRATPIALVSRGNAAAFRFELPQEPLSLSTAAERVQNHLAARGASFFDDIAAGTKLDAENVELGLAELVANGVVTSDAFAGLRALTLPDSMRTPRERRRGPLSPMDSAGRWSLLPPYAPTSGEDEGETVAWTLLRRYGVVFRRVVERESSTPPWRELVRVYRRLEARGDIRGGRFVAGFSGEQYALPEAVESLRAVRRSAKSGLLVSVSAADPANLTGLVTPGERVPAVTSNRVLYRDGAPVARKVGDDVSLLPSEAVDPEEKSALLAALVRGGTERPVVRVRLAGR
jgi:ATP-dependent Lhr-like helicase